MRIRWVKVWVDSMATLTERFRDDEGRVDFEALGREEYAFRHALVTGDFSRSERARDLYDATINEITSRSEAGRKGAEARWSKNTAAATTSDGVDVSANGCNLSPETGTVYGRPQDRPERACCMGDGTPDPQGGPKSGNIYDQETSPAGAGVNLDSTQTNKRPDASSSNAEGVITNGSPITRNGSRAVCTSAPSGQTFEAPLRPGAGEVPPENVSAKPSPALPVPAKKAHGEFGNVMLTDDEFAKLCEKCADADALITELDQYIESQGKTKKYKSHYATLLNWSRRKAQEAKQKNGYKTAAEKDADVLKELAEYYDKMEAV